MTVVASKQFAASDIDLFICNLDAKASTEKLFDIIRHVVRRMKDSDGDIVVRLVVLQQLLVCLALG